MLISPLPPPCLLTKWWFKVKGLFILSFLHWYMLLQRKICSFFCVLTSCPDLLFYSTSFLLFFSTPSLSSPYSLTMYFYLFSFILFSSPLHSTPFSSLPSIHSFDLPLLFFCLLFSLISSSPHFSIRTLSPPHVLCLCYSFTHIVTAQPSVKPRLWRNNRN